MTSKLPYKMLSGTVNTGRLTGILHPLTVEHYLEVCAGKSDEMKMKQMVHLQFHAIRLSYSHILEVFNGMASVADTVVFS